MHARRWEEAGRDGRAHHRRPAAVPIRGPRGGWPGGWHVVAEAEAGEDAVALAAQLHPEVVLMDINLPGISGIEATRRVLAAAPTTVVVLMSTCGADDLPADAADCGAAAYLHKEDLTPAALRALC